MVEPPDEFAYAESIIARAWTRAPGAIARVRSWGFTNAVHLPPDGGDRGFAIPPEHAEGGYLEFGQFGRFWDGFSGRVVILDE